MPSVTATIITFNEEDRIVECLASLACCDEVILVDSGSTDRTRELAKATGVRVLERSWEGYSEQKNFAAKQARHDCILSIDADERLSIELANEIVAWKRADPGARAVSMPRRVLYLGRWIRHSGWYPDRKVRLYDRRFCRWEGDFVHESMNVKGEKLGEHGIEKVIKECGTAGPKDLVERLVNAVHQHAIGRPPHDDVTVVAFGRRS